jgi:hypothetical protein
MPWLVIFIILYFILKLFPGWVSPFSNTIGYLFVTMLGVTNILENIMEDAKIEEEPDLVKAINTIKNNKSQFINQIDLNLSNFETFISQLKQAKIIQYGETSDELIIKLYKLITIKHVIGKIVWYVLAGILISSISYNFIIGISCEKSVDQIIKDYEEANPEEEE